MTHSVLAVNVWFQTIRSPEGGKAVVVGLNRKRVPEDWVQRKRSFSPRCSCLLSASSEQKHHNNSLCHSITKLSQLLAATAHEEE